MKLFEAGKIGRLSIKNRVVMAAMGVHALAEPDGRLSQRGIDYYVARAKGGSGLIITGAARTRQIEQLSYTPFVNGMVIDGSLSTGRLSELADAVHDYGAKIAVQLLAGRGHNAGTELRGRGEPVAASTLPCFFDPNVVAREIRVEEIERLVDAFEFAGEIVNKAGIDAIELNCHSGYLPDEFMTALWNKRTDEYGGDLDGRLRFLVEIIEGIKKGAGEKFPIIVKFGLTHYLNGARDIAEGLEIARKLEATGVNALDIDGGCYETMYLNKPTTYSGPGSFVGLAEMVKEAVNIPVITVGKLGNPDLAESVLQEGKADFIALGRPLLADPEWPNKARAGRREDIRPCIGGYEGCSARIGEEKYISCTVNPATGMEREFAVRPAEGSKFVLVVGGGAAGMEAARVAAIRGHEVALWEKEDSLGGNLIPASIPDFKRDYRDLRDYLITQIGKLGVNIELRREATPESVQAEKPDAVVVATGSTPIIPEIKGIENGNVGTALEVLSGKKSTGERVIVIGGGMVGCETALYLARKGQRVTVVELSDILCRGKYLANRMHLIKLITDANVKVFVNSQVSEILDNSIGIVDNHGKNVTLKADTVVLASGSQPNKSLYESLDGRVSEIYAIGDCVEPRKLMNAIWEGFRTARLI